MLKISVCIGSACHLKGSFNVINTLQDEIESKKLSDKIDVKGVFCTGHCTEAVSVCIGEDEFFSVKGENTTDFFNNQVIPRLK